MKFPSPALLLVLFLFSINLASAQESVESTTSETPTNTEETPQVVEAQSFFEMVKSGNVDLVQKTMRDSVDYYAHTKDGETALTLAIKSEDVDMVKILVKDAVINLKNKEGETPLTLAIKQGNSEITKLVCRRAKGSLKNNMGEAPLFLAVEKNDLFLVEELIKKGADVNRPSNGVTPLAHAAELNNFRAVGYLVRAGANVNLPNDNGDTPLFLAINNGFDVTAGILINKSEDPMAAANWRSKIDETLLNIAIVKSHPEVVKILLDAGARVDDQDYFENSALHIAAGAGNTEILEILLMHGLPIDQRNLKGETPVMLAAKENQKSAVRYLIENGANGDLKDYTGYAVNENFDVGSIEVKKQPERNSRLSKFKPTKQIKNDEEDNTSLFINHNN